DPVARQENEAAAVLAGLRQDDAQLPAGVLEERVRHLDQDARAVARVRLGAGRAPVVEVLQDLDRLPEDLVRLAALYVDDESHAAGVVLKPRVVKALLRGRAEGPGPGGAGVFRSGGHRWNAGFSGLEQVRSQIGLCGRMQSAAGGQKKGRSRFSESGPYRSRMSECSRRQKKRIVLVAILACSSSEHPAFVAAPAAASVGLTRSLLRR